VAPEKSTISFRDNMAGAFGLVLRSSAIFYYRKKKDFQTTISFMNYWKAKRSLDVAVVASTRDMAGQLLSRELLEMTTHAVINYQPGIDREEFEGSVEIEVFGNQNMVIPYAAVMAVYETPRSISTVHSYARAYSNFEVEEGRTISSGSEGCWSLRDTDEVDSFGVFHNGSRATARQACRLEVRNRLGESRTAVIDMPELSPYQSMKLKPKDHVPGLVAFLAGSIGQASLSYSLGEGFTRMLVGNERRDSGDFQVTHSNFNYREQKTDHLDDAKQGSFMHVPSCGIAGKQIVVYPQSSEGKYTMDHAGKLSRFVSGDLVLEPVSQAHDLLTFRRSDGPFPTRLVTGMVLPNQGSLIENECSLGALTHLQPRKRFWWGICSADDRRSSSLVVHDVPEIYGGIRGDSAIEISLYSSTGADPLKTRLDPRDLTKLDPGIPFDDLFPGGRARQHLNGQFGYFTLFNDYGGLTTYTLLDNKLGSRAMEHSF
jgi:hypothetical protein